MEIPYHCAEGAVHNDGYMAAALEKSCNLIHPAGADDVHPVLTDYYSAFGLYERTGIDLPYDSAGIS